MNKLYIMVGIPGSGKSTFIKKFLPNVLHVSRDEIRFNLVKEDEEYFSKEDEVFQQFINDIQTGINNNIDVAADATHLNPKSRMKLLSALKIDKEKTQICVIYMKTLLARCLINNEKRKNTRAYVPPKIILDMYKSFKKPNFEECYGLIDIIHTIEINYKGDN